MRTRKYTVSKAAKQKRIQGGLKATVDEVNGSARMTGS
jgi:hypothetical protein